MNFEYTEEQQQLADSLRKFLTHSELELIARIAAPEAFVRARGLNPGYSMLEVLR